MNSIITIMGSSKSRGSVEKSCVVSLRNGSNDCDKDEPLDDLFLGAIFFGDEAMAGGC